MKIEIENMTDEELNKLLCSDKVLNGIMSDLSKLDSNSGKNSQAICEIIYGKYSNIKNIGVLNGR